ncbi:hypothetical protein [Roseovarius rhodophyticola]|uniref:SMI1/KNR4 family protein n=1 Tax=Roseovarius rhodophyticola TaxID=3080827 RepID=A0ABZ2TKZ2_9RHOB|nr:hypothetical protein [Roseovarius sp. W115]MDV2929397.1 hypothetical protein [Roseovarius sp. W115]
MLTDKILVGMRAQGLSVSRQGEHLKEVEDSLIELGLEEHDQVKVFFEKYKLGAVLSKQLTELMDLCSPTRQIFRTTEFARDIYELPDGYICLTSGEGEGFILYSLLDRKVYDLSVTQFKDLADGKCEATWNSFFELIEWYLE